MSKVAHYLQEHLVGEVMTSIDARRYFATDASIFSLPPAIVVYPRNENDVRKTARFTWQLAERGRIIPVTGRGLGTDQSGAALGNGIMMVFPAHMHRLLEFDSKSGDVTVEPGINFGKLQQTLFSHYRFLPPYPASSEYSTIGGAIANNAGGERSVKYGTIRNFVKRLRFVLANGEVIEVRRLNRRELNKKLGLNSLEGEIYRQVDRMLEENHALIEKSRPQVTKNAAGYNLWDIRKKDGSFNLVPLLVGSQGTLGIVTEATLETEQHNPNTTLIVTFVDDLNVAQEIISELRKFSELPATIEMVDSHLLEFVQAHSPTLLKNVVDPPFQKIALFIEFDNLTDRVQKRTAKKAVKLLNKYKLPYRMETDPDQKEQLWKIRQAAATVLSHNEGGAKPVPIIEDGVVPIDRFQEFLTGIYEIFNNLHLPISVWGHAGNANLHVQPLLNLGQVGDRQKVFKLLDDYYSLVMRLGGSTTGEHGDGRLRGPFLEQLYGTEMYNLFRQVKQIFDPYGTLNPGVKIGVTLEDVKPLIRQEYDLMHFYDHMPRS
ncbi:MAG TPA: FAD-binding oxidoreductase [Patescibacteria group bacterium]|nr:FAD-binding oxidoreductase [Patescibacteria group bacterium]